MKNENGLFIFHRDLRIYDNKGFIEASNKCKNLHTCFIFTPEQVSSKNDFRSQNSIQFMIESLLELEITIKKKGGKLHIYYGNQNDILNKLINEVNIDGIYFNTDYSPYAKKREKKTKELCSSLTVDCESFFDYYLYEPGSVKTSTGSFYKKFTPFYNDVKQRKVLPVSKTTNSNLSIIDKNFAFDFSLEDAYNKFASKNKNILVHGGRTNGLKQLKGANKEQKEYNEKRDFFIYETSRMSAYLKYGCISVREMYYLLKHNNELTRQLIWREFYAHVLNGYPEVIGNSYQEKYRDLHWKGSKKQLDLWKEGKTGFPIVDASMREMNATGYMHNRGRMIVATFLIKVLLIDWKEGEKYFAQQLTDYDVASNNGNWQNISGTGVDMTPYFRYMSPWIQSKKFDSKAEYIKKWIPELKSVSSKDIHNWDSAYKNYTVDYPKPIVDFSAKIKEMLKMYENA